MTTSQPAPVPPRSASDLFGARAIATVTLGGTLTDKLDAAASAGYDGIELCSPDLELSPLSPARVRQEAEARGLAVFIWQPLRDMEGVPPAKFRANLAAARGAFTIAAQLGATTVVVTSNVQPDASADFGRTATQLRDLADVAAGFGLDIAYEALSWGTFCYTYRHAWSLVSAARRPNLGICLDSFHIGAREEDLEGIGRIPAGKIFAVQLADAPRLPLDYRTWSRNRRRWPGDGDLGVSAFARAVRGTGYDGAWSLEIFNPEWTAADPKRTAEDGMRALDRLSYAAQQ